MDDLLFDHSDDCSNPSNTWGATPYSSLSYLHLEHYDPSPTELFLTDV